MSKLEDLLPELAGVFAAQESAMENVVSLLTTQVAQLIQSGEQQSRRVASLEAALLAMRTAHDSFAEQQRSAETSQSETVGAIAASVEGMEFRLQQQMSQVEAKWHDVEARLEAAGGGPSETQVMGLVGEHLNAVESKLTAHLEHRLLETSNRSYLQVQHAEEAMKTELEVLEKKFEYLSRVKMEIKDMSKKIEKQDQTLDDMRMGMELLSKSIGTDESDNEGDGDGRNDDDHDAGAEGDNNGDTNSKKPLRRVDRTEVMNVMKRISLSSADIQAKINENSALAATLAAAAEVEAPKLAAEAAQETLATRVVRSKSVSAVPGKQAAFARSKTVDAAPGGRSTTASFETRHARTSRRGSGDDGEAISLARPDKSDGAAELEASLQTPASIPEVSEDAANEPSQEETSAPPPPETTPLEPADSVAESPEDSIETADTSRSALPEETATESEEHIHAAPQEEEIEIRQVTPEQAPEAEEEDGETAEESDHVVEIAPPSSTSRARLSSRGDPTEENASRHSPATMQHMLSTPNMAMLYPTFNASTAMIRSRRATRMVKRQNSNVRKDSTLDSSRSETRMPMAKEVIKELWRRMFTRFVQLKRLQILSGTNPDRIFRKQNMSVGARVKRLEETTADLEEMVDVLEVNIQHAQVLGQSIAQHQADMDATVAKLHEDKQLQGQMIVGVEEKLDLIELDLRRVRTSSRRESGQSVSSSIVNSLAAQQQELATKFSDHMNSAFQSVEQTVKKLSEFEVPALSSKFESVIHDFRLEMDHKSKELAKELYKAVDRVHETQVANGVKLVRRTNAFVERLYRDILTLSRAHLVSLDMVRSARAQSPKKKRSLFDVGLEMLQHIFFAFQEDCKTLLPESSEPAAVARATVLERAFDFLHELEKLKEQAAKAKASAISAFGSADVSDGAATSSSSSFTDRLVLVTTTQLKALESLLASNETPRSGENDGDKDDDDDRSWDVSCQIKDLVVQLRAVLVLLFLHSELLDPHQKLQVVLTAQDAMRQEIRAHDFSLAQLNTVGATVKMMNSRLDSFLEMSVTFAKDDDVKKSIQEMLNSSDSVRDNLSQQLETTHFEAQKRDEILERELTQLVGRVNKKLDKDELLWTQEVIERQLQSVAKSSLGEDDLHDLHRLLRNKLDKTYFNALLLEQRNRMAENGGAGGGSSGSGGGGGVPGNAPLIGAKCISCSGELPPTKAMIKSVVKDQVQQEVAKTLARQQQQHQSGVVTAAAATLPSSTSFNASTHRSMEKYKKELMATTLQQQQHQKSQARK